MHKINLIMRKDQIDVIETFHEKTDLRVIKGMVKELSQIDLS